MGAGMLLSLTPMSASSVRRAVRRRHRLHLRASASTRASVDYSATSGNMSPRRWGRSRCYDCIGRGAGRRRCRLPHPQPNTGNIIAPGFLGRRCAAVDGDLSISASSRYGQRRSRLRLSRQGARHPPLLRRGGGSQIEIAGSSVGLPASCVDARIPASSSRPRRSSPSTSSSPENRGDKRPMILLRAGAPALRCADWMAADEDVAALHTTPQCGDGDVAGRRPYAFGLVLGQGELRHPFGMISSASAPRRAAHRLSRPRRRPDRVPGRVAHRAMVAAARDFDILIGHPRSLSSSPPRGQRNAGPASISLPTFYRTAARLFQGEVLFRAGRALRVHPRLGPSPRRLAGHDPATVERARLLLLTG